LHPIQQPFEVVLLDLLDEEDVPERERGRKREREREREKEKERGTNTQINRK